jgi:hypothetical protein
LAFGSSQPAAALTQATFQACLGPSAPLGQADKIDGTGGNAIGAGSGAPYNLAAYDDAVVCVDQHTASGSVDTAAEFVNEVANTASHELGHLLGLEHGDGAANSLMNGTYTGVDLGFSTAAEQAVMNAQPALVQIVFLDFALASGEIPNPNPYPGGFASASVLSSFGIVGAAAIQAAINSIVANIQADFVGPWTNGTTYEFYTSETDAVQAALIANGNLDYSTVLFVAPEPGTLLLLLAGLAGLARLQRPAAR